MSRSSCQHVDSQKSLEEAAGRRQQPLTGAQVGPGRMRTVCLRRPAVLLAAAGLLFSIGLLARRERPQGTGGPEPDPRTGLSQLEEKINGLCECHVRDRV